jgi:hypothetical protein
LAAVQGNRYARRMMLKRRRIKWADGTDAANDFSVIDERGKKIGRIYRTVAVGGVGPWRPAKLMETSRILPNSVNSSCDNRPTPPPFVNAGSHNCFGLRLNF